MDQVNVAKSPSKSPHSAASRPRRGRPSGANRTPLSLEERRARNAQYERERRNDAADATAELIAALGCDSNISMTKLMALAITKLQNVKEEPSIEELNEMNLNLEGQIAYCIEELGPDYVIGNEEEGEKAVPDEPNYFDLQTRKRKLVPENTFSEKRMRPGDSQQSLPPLSLPPQTVAIDEMDVAVRFSQEQLQLIYDAIDADTTSTMALSMAAPPVGALQLPSLPLPLPHLLTMPPSPPPPPHPQTSLEEVLTRIFFRRRRFTLLEVCRRAAEQATAYVCGSEEHVQAMALGEPNSHKHKLSHFSMLREKLMWRETSTTPAGTGARGDVVAVRFSQVQLQLVYEAFDNVLFSTVSAFYGCRSGARALLVTAIETATDTTNFPFADIPGGKVFRMMFLIVLNHRLADGINDDEYHTSKQKEMS
ncbi:hypothetical protein HF086_014065 [Spodoptera exigua]|uniref:BHLH domain-containing protein n=1 Tax=Spodoptera exigua TaxID=7107 RepID=A0A922MMP3_SPOEX|nr:hypothetical protein HF086_014065 [Spodoptera exigua]